MFKKTSGCIGFVVLVALLVLSLGERESALAGATKEADFYKGKVIDCIVPYRTGGGYDNWVRALSLFFTKYTGATLVTKNMPGAGGLVGTNKLYTSDTNGLTIGILNGPGLMQAQLTGIGGVKFDLLKFTWLGRLTSEQKVICVGSKSKFKTLEAMKQSARPIKFGAPGLGSSMFMEAALAAEALGLKIDLVTGYETSEEVDLAVIRGELDAATGSFSSKIDTVKNGDMALVAQFGDVKETDLTNVPNLGNLPGMSSEGKQLIELLVALGGSGRFMAGPPRANPERMKVLEEALKKTLEDPGFIQLAKKQQMDIIYLPPGGLLRIIEKGVYLSPGLKGKLQEILARYQPKK
jgi:tripartite-type tricarboxylate transporter receptor subunit TctC